MAAENLTDDQIEARLATLERLMARATHPSDPRSLNTTYQRLVEELVRRDLQATKGGN